MGAYYRFQVPHVPSSRFQVPSSTFQAGTRVPLPLEPQNRERGTWNLEPETWNLKLEPLLPKQVLSRRQVIVPGDGVDLTLAQLGQRLRFDPLRGCIRGVASEDIVGEFGGPFEVTSGHGFPRARQRPIGTAEQRDQFCRARLLGQRKQLRGVAVEPARAVRVDAANAPFDP